MNIVNPDTIGDGLSGIAFTETSAWAYVHGLLVAGFPLEVVPLDKPPDKVGYVMKVPVGGRVLYIKLMLTNAGVHGRSFHWSDR
ncbi:MAG TPA: hypothetical protein VGE27_04320 [Gemmatimonas sp.]|uniref:hypothetical protein n=1 Tax=Gemmatimonas sp. TaxID=1962908 RepID=UPI002EDAB517